MSVDHGGLPGFIAVSGDGRALPQLPRTSVEQSTASREGVATAYWGLTNVAEAGDLTLILSPVRRTSNGELTPTMITDLLRLDASILTRLLPPFAVVSASGPTMIMVVDSMGLRQTYHTDPGAGGQSSMGTSAIHVAQAHGSGLDERACAVQSLLGWQLGQRTLFTGVSKLGPGRICRLSQRGVELDQHPEDEAGVIPLDEAVVAAARLLRSSLEHLLDDHPDAVLQLTGGQDSRLLLSAIPPARRRGLRAMTLGTPGGDVAVAGDLARRYGLHHEVHDLCAVDDVAPDEAWHLTRIAAVQLDGMSDPVAHAALAIAEDQFEQGVRISGLGGEVARGFYYIDRVGQRAVTERRARRLAAWRMFANESVEPGLLDPEFSDWARLVADQEVHTALAASGKDWDRATDELYLLHRMQRWAGVTETAVSSRRTVINPMLDWEFLSLAQRLSPADKANSLFLARLQMELDPDLGRLPLEGRPAPVIYAERGLVHRSRQQLVVGTRLARKAVQRVRGVSRPPAGGAVLASKVVAYWRDHPHELTWARRAGFVSGPWLDGVLDGVIDPSTSSVAFLTNLVVAAEATRARRSTAVNVDPGSNAG